MACIHGRVLDTVDIRIAVITAGRLLMDAIALLKDDHRKVKKIFSDLNKEKGDRRSLFRELDNELTVHAEIEEKVFYPAAKNAEPTRDLVLESIEEHKQIKMVLGDLEKADMRTDEWAADLQVLQEDVEHHIGEEEDDLFPKVKKLLSTSELEELGARMERMKSERLAAAKRR
jgi:hemerythrin superfamily protein